MSFLSYIDVTYNVCVCLIHIKKKSSSHGVTMLILSFWWQQACQQTGELKGVRVMVFNTTFNNISAISWQSVLLVEETKYPEKTTDHTLKTSFVLNYIKSLHFISIIIYFIVSGCNTSYIINSIYMYITVVRIYYEGMDDTKIFIS